MDVASPKRGGRRPKAPDVEFNSASTNGGVADGPLASSSASGGLDEEVDLGFDSPESEPVSISDLEAVFQPGQAPPRWGGSDPALADLGAPSDVEPAPHSSESSAASLRRMGELVGGALSSENPTSARSILAPVVVVGRASQAPPLSSQPLSDRELLFENPEKSKPEAAPPPANKRHKLSFFDVGPVPGSDLFDAAPAPFDPHVPALPGGAGDDSDPDSGLLDIRRLAVASRGDDKKKKISSGRASDDIFNLSGGLFAGGTSGPMGAPDLNALIAPVVSDTSRPGVSTVRSRGAAVPPPAKSAPTAASAERPRSSVAPAATPQASPGSGLGSRAKLAGGIALFGVVLVLVFLKMAQSPTTTPTVTTTETAAPIVATETAKPAPPIAAPPPTASPEAPTAARDPAAAKRDKEPAAAAPAGAATTSTVAAPTPRSTAAASPGGAAAAPVAAAPPVTAAPVVVAPPPPAAAEFNKSAAVAALAAAAGRAAGCKQPDGPSGGATVSITFAPSGRVTSSKVTGPPFQGTPVGGCIASAFRSASVPPFDGSPITVTKTVNVR
jgi:hypothetical protein